MTNISSEEIQEARNLTSSAKSVLVVLPKNPSVDNVATGLSLYLALSSSGKQVSIFCPKEMTVEFNRLIGVDKIKNNLGNQEGKNLIISFPYQEGSIEKVSYNIDNDNFNLVIEPREGYPIITPEVMRYSFNGGNTDLIITIGVYSPNEFQDLDSNTQSLFSQKPIINIDFQNHNSRFGKVNLVDTNVSCLSEIVIYLFSQLGWNINQDIASNLFYGLTSGSQNFTSPKTTATTFEAAAICLRQGGVKSQISEEMPTATNISQTIKPTVAKPPTTNFPNQPPSFKGKGPAKKPSIDQFYQPSPREATHPETPPDWLKPKIYKGSTLL